VSDLVLSLFPGIGLLDMAFEEEGFCVVRGPDLLWGGDVKRFHAPAGKFAGIIGGPPCKRFTPLANINRARYGEDALAPNLIPEFARVVEEAQPDWFLMENVPQAPPPVVSKYTQSFVILNNRWLGEKQNRKRKFSFGIRGLIAAKHLLVELAALEHFDFEPAVTGNSGGRRAVPVLDGNGRMRGHQGEADWHRLRRRSIEQLCELQGAPRELMTWTPFTAAAKREVLANGVPLPMGRAIAKAVHLALEQKAAVQP
jgi:DNA (cytosine-5)-methyltransferase 1